MLKDVLIFLGLLASNAFIWIPTRISAHHGKMYTLAGATSDGDVVKLWNEATTAHQAGLLDEAAAAYDRLITQFDDVVPDAAATSTLSIVHGNRGAIYMSTGDYDKARDAFNSAITLSPLDANAQFNLAVVLTSKFREHRKALRHCKLAIKLEPGRPNSLHLMANILQELGAKEEAERYYRMAEAASGASDDSKGNKASMVWADLAPTLAAATRGQKFVVDGQEMECLSMRPHVFYIPSLLSEEECDAVIERSRPHLEESFVMGDSTLSSSISELDSDGGVASVSDPYRVSDVAWLSPDALLKEVQLRLATLTGFDVQSLRWAAEELQVIHYAAPQGQFKAHHDSTGFKPRLLTALIYLNNLDTREGEGEGEEEHGGTWFPYASDNGGGHDTPPSSVDEAVATALRELNPAQRGLTIAPKKGAAILFFNHRPDGSVDHLAVHAGLPVLNGEKWAANFWYGPMGNNPE